MLPVFFRRGNQALVVGGGKVALRKVGALLRGSAIITIESPEICQPLLLLAEAKDDNITLYQRLYEKRDLSSFDLVFACTNEKSVNESVAADASRCAVAVNVADNPSLCDFYMPATGEVSAQGLEGVEDGVTIAVGSGGVPALAAALRDRIIADLPADIGNYAAALSVLRSGDLWRSLPEKTRHRVMLQLVDKILEDDADFSGSGVDEIMSKMNEFVLKNADA